MPLGYTAYFGTSTIRPYTGPTGAQGNPISGTGGIKGPCGPSPLSTDAPTGPTGVTGFALVGTYYQHDPTKPAYGYYVLRFSDQAGNEVTAAPRGLTGKAGPVSRWADADGVIHDPENANFYNVGTGVTAIFAGVTYGSLDPNRLAPFYGVSGATLSFRRLGVSGDLVFYSDLKTIGTGPTYDVIGISGPIPEELYGTVTGQSVGEIAYLSDKKNTKDAHGLTFTDDSTIIPPGLPSGGLTWGTITPKLINTTNFFHTHGNEVEGVNKDPFIINTDQGGVHVIHTPFTLSGITFDKHTTKNPIAVAPSWVSAHLDLSGNTANYGEAVNTTLIIKNGPLGVSFGGDFYFDPHNNKLAEGINIVNCLSYDDAESWLCTIAGNKFGFTGDTSEIIQYGACCNSTPESSSFGDCQEFLTLGECNQKEDYDFYLNSSCEESPCSAIPIIGSCCLNKDPLIPDETLCVDDVEKIVCETFGGVFRLGIPCNSQYPCGNSCDEDFGDTGSCCKFDETGSYIGCEDDLTLEECIESGILNVYNGDGSFCVNIDCCSVETRVGACCTDIGVCTDQTTPVECSQLGGIYQGHNTTCSGVVCACTSDGGEPQPECTEDYDCEGNPNGPRCCFGECTELTCDPVTTMPCCLGNGTCVNVQYESECTDFAGTIVGTQGTICDDIDCEGGTGILHPCCIQLSSGDYVCQLLDSPTCFDVGGVFYPNQSQCCEIPCGSVGDPECEEDANCPPGQCCNNGLCEDCDDGPPGREVGKCCNAIGFPGYDKGRRPCCEDFMGILSGDFVGGLHPAMSSDGSISDVYDPETGEIISRCSEELNWPYIADYVYNPNLQAHPVCDCVDGLTENQCTERFGDEARWEEGLQCTAYADGKTCGPYKALIGIAYQKECIQIGDTTLCSSGTIREWYPCMGQVYMQCNVWPTVEFADDVGWIGIGSRYNDENYFLQTFGAYCPICGPCYGYGETFDPSNSNVPAPPCWEDYEGTGGAWCTGLEGVSEWPCTCCDETLHPDGCSCGNPFCGSSYDMDDDVDGPIINPQP